jgi:Carboxypeptidase regulatory-like domain
MRRLVKLLVVLVGLVLVPEVARAQSAITGVVRDASGAVLPGVTVEASSPALIEKVRAGVTDGQGRYSIVDLRPGVYTVTFTLTGFKSLRREGIQLPSSFTATVDAELAVGAVEETLTVTGAAPIVDVQTVTQQRTLSQEILEAIPTGRLPQSYTLLITGVTQSPENYGAGLHNAFSQGNLQFHGMGETQLLMDGFPTRHVSSTGGAQYTMNQGVVQEVVVTAGSAGADQQGGGIVSNAVPKDGGNRFSGQMYVHFANEHFVGENISAELRALGATSQSVRRQWDVNPVFGGPLVLDKVWFLASYRNTASEVDSGMPFDRYPLDWVYTPDYGRKTGSERIHDKNYSLRMTWQATRRNKFTVYYDLQPKDWYNRAIGGTAAGARASGVSGRVAPEASQFAPYVPQYIGQLLWKSPVSNRLLLEAGTSYQHTVLQMRPNDREATFGGAVSPDLFAISAQDQATSNVFRGRTEQGLWHRSRTLRSRASATYVTGSQAWKVGVDLPDAPGIRDRAVSRPGDYAVRVNQGVPNLITLWAPEVFTSRVDADLGVFTQDQWTFRRATINAGVRYDYLTSSIPAQAVPANRWLPARHFDAVDKVLGWHDVSPRLGFAYDLFGDGRTAVKVSVNRYVAAESTATTDNNNPVLTSVLSATRTWTDSNADFLPNCDFNDAAANGECGRLSDLNFGRQNPTATRYDANLLTGFTVRPYNWETGASIQHELIPGLAVQGAYFRRVFGNLRVTRNLEVGPGDFDPYCITVPTDPRLPRGGGYQQCGYYDVSPAKFGRRQSFVTFASNYGKQTQVWDGVEFNLNARLGSRQQVTAGTSTARMRTNTCLVVDTPQQLLFCDVRPPFQTQVKIMGFSALPFGLQASVVLQSLPGPELSATTYVASNAEIAPSLGRTLAAGAAATATVPLVQPGTMYGEQFNKLDLRLTKIVRLGGRRLTGSLDIFNVLNGAGVLQVNTTYGPEWLHPTSVMGARMFRLSAQIDFEEAHAGACARRSAIAHTLLARSPRSAQLRACADPRLPAARRRGATSGPCASAQARPGGGSPDLYPP